MEERLSKLEAIIEEDSGEDSSDEEESDTPDVGDCPEQGDDILDCCGCGEDMASELLNDDELCGSCHGDLSGIPDAEAIIAANGFEWFDEYAREWKRTVQPERIRIEYSGRVYEGTFRYGEEIGMFRSTPDHLEVSLHNGENVYHLHSGTGGSVGVHSSVDSPLEHEVFRSNLRGTLYGFFFDWIVGDMRDPWKGDLKKALDMIGLHSMRAHV